MNNTNTTLGAEELYLAPEEEIKNAKAIASALVTAEKNTYTVFYAPAEKNSLLSALKQLGCSVEEQANSIGSVQVTMSDAQLAAVKTLSCVERVEAHNTGGEENSLLHTMEENGTMTLAAAETAAVAVASCGGDCDTDSVFDMSDAVSIDCDVYNIGTISCPGAALWYKFTSTTTESFTFQTIGTSDTVGELYDADGNLLDCDDDSGDSLNFRIVYSLVKGETYYIKVRVYGNNTGSFNFGVMSTIYIESITVNNGLAMLNKGDSTLFTVTILPENASSKKPRWESSNTGVAVVDSDGVVTAVGVGSAYITAYAQDGSGKSGQGEVYVYALAETVTVDLSDRMMRVGETAYFTATVCPYDTSDKTVHWSSSDTSVATVNAESGLVTAKSVGKATITATAQDGSGQKGECALTVEPPIAVQRIVLCDSSYTMNVGESTYLSYVIYPTDATNQTVTWCSSDPNVAEVDSATGKITAKLAGTTTITVTTNDGSFVGSCTVRVVIDTVTIKKDGNYSKVIFTNEKIWKCNRFYYNYDTETFEPTDYQRINHNASIDFSEKQLGFLFRIDPNSVIFYVKNKELGDDKSPTDYLIYRDNIFEEIYGRKPKYFTYENSQLYYYTGIDKNNRYSVYSEAELIFGMLPRWTWQNVVETLLGAALEILASLVLIPSWFTLSIEIVTAFFFTGAFDGVMNSAATEFINEFMESNYNDKLPNRFSWATTIVGLIPSLLESALPPDIDEEQISIYENAYKNESYVIKISDNNQTVDLNEFIEHYKSLIPA